MTPFDFFLWSMATWRLTALLVYDTITAPLRDAIGVEYDEMSECRGRNFPAQALCCHKCTSIWVAIGITFIFIQPEPLAFIPLVLALSAASIAINKLVNGE